MKKIFSIFVCLGLIVIVAGCGMEVPEIGIEGKWRFAQETIQIKDNKIFDFNGNELKYKREGNYLFVTNDDGDQVIYEIIDEDTIIIHNDIITRIK